MKLLTCVTLAASFVATGCAHHTPEKTSSSSEAAAAVTPWPSVLLNDHTIPPGGAVNRSASNWVVHGSMDSVVWHYGSNDNLLRVANQAVSGWSDLGMGREWTISCAVANRTDIHCDVSILRAVAGGLVGLTVRDKDLCVSGGGFRWPGDLVIDDSAPHRTLAACFSPSASATLLSALLAGRRFSVKSLHQDGEPMREAGFPSYGLKQALTLRDWMRERYAAGDLQTKDSL